MGYSWTSKIWDTHDFKNMGYSWTSKIWYYFKNMDTHLQKYGILMDFKNILMGYS